MALKPDDFRKAALAMPRAIESAHMGHPDFRVKGKIFATLFSRDGIEWGMVKLKPDQQSQFVKDKPEVFQPIKGGWGRQGCTQVCLGAADRDSIREAIFTAWCNTAPKGLLEDSLTPRAAGTKKAPARTRRTSIKKAAAKKVTGKKATRRKK